MTKTNRKPQRPLTLRTLASLIAKREGKRSQARIGDIREVLKIIAQLEAEDCVRCDQLGAPDDTCQSPLAVLTDACNRELRKLRKARKVRR